MFHLRIRYNAIAIDSPLKTADRELAEQCLRCFAQGAGLDLHLHPGDYETPDTAISTAFPFGGDPLFDAVAVLRFVR